MSEGSSVLKRLHGDVSKSLASAYLGLLEYVFYTLHMRKFFKGHRNLSLGCQRVYFIHFTCNSISFNHARRPPGQ